jgi:hypothetical protein
MSLSSKKRSMSFITLNDWYFCHFILPKKYSISERKRGFHYRRLHDTSYNQMKTKQQNMNEQNTETVITAAEMISRCS